MARAMRRSEAFSARVEWTSAQREAARPCRNATRPAASARATTRAARPSLRAARASLRRRVMHRSRRCGRLAAKSRPRAIASCRRGQSRAQCSASDRKARTHKRSLRPTTPLDIEVSHGRSGMRRTQTLSVAPERCAVVGIVCSRPQAQRTRHTEAGSIREGRSDLEHRRSRRADHFVRRVASPVSTGSPRAGSFRRSVSCLRVAHASRR